MALKDTVKNLRELLSSLTYDLEKADGGNKAASQRVRTGTVRLEKVAKLYRKESIKQEKSTKSPKKAGSKKFSSKKPLQKATTKSKTVKAKPRAKEHRSSVRALSFKRPTAKLLTH